MSICCQSKRRVIQMVSTKEIRERIEQIIDPSTGKTLRESAGIKHIGIDDEKQIVILVIAIGKKTTETEVSLKRELAKIIKLEFKFQGMKLELEELRKIESIVNGRTKFVMIASGKGGVGKSTVAANIAYALTRQGKKVGIIDADIYGASIPKILQVPHENPKGDANGKIVPFTKGNIELISTEFFTDINKPVIWRGAMLNSMLNHFFYDVKWSSDLDFMIIDAPPGTGDIPLDVRNIAPDTEVLLVTTPHLAASHVAIKAGVAAQELHHEVIGVIENMSYYVNPATKDKEFIFGQGGGQEVADKLNTELIAQIPICQPEYSLSLYEAEEQIGQMYDDLALFLIARQILND